MKHFRKIGDVDVTPIMDRVRSLRLEVARDDDFTIDGLLHKAVALRMHENATHESFFEDYPVYDLPLLSGWQEMRDLIDDARALIEVDPVIGPQVDVDALGRVVFSVVYPNSFIQWHRDTGKYIDRTLRFHVPLITTPHAVNYAPDETLHMDVGELTWLANRELHSAGNWSDQYRTHLLFELRCRT